MSKVDEYIAKKGNDWSTPIMEKLRVLALSCDVEEGVKWGAPTYMNNGNVFAFAAFKNWVALWFFQGALIHDEANVLMASDDKTKALRQWRFKDVSELRDDLILKYMEAATELMKAGEKIPVQKNTKPIIVPEELQKALDQDTEIKRFFENLSPSHRREYADYIREAKKEETRLRRTAKAMEMMANGLDLNAKYRK